MTLLLDKDTHLVRRAMLDMTKVLESQGAADVKEASITIDYPSVKPGAAVKPEQFAWTPPSDAKDMAKEQAASEGDEPAMALQKKPAPEFTLKGLDDKDVSLKDQKGSVVVLDFWATWCPPCREGLPHIDKLAKDYKDKGVKAFAIDLQEKKDQVQKYVTDNKLELPALLDTEGKTAKAYSVTGIPQTVIIGKDGVVQKVFIGLTPEEEVKAAIDAALK
jgi:thiol-disulfide isomerase/thioredoxin